VKSGGNVWAVKQQKTKLMCSVQESCACEIWGECVGCEKTKKRDWCAVCRRVVHVKSGGNVWAVKKQKTTGVQYAGELCMCNLWECVGCGKKTILACRRAVHV